MEWLESLPENVREWDEAKNSTTREEFFAQMENHRSMIGNSVRFPSEDASDEDKTAFLDKVLKGSGSDLMRRPKADEDIMKMYREFGMPEEDAGYVDPKFELPEGVQTDADRIASFRKLAHKHNLTQKQFEGLVADVVNPELLDKGSKVKAETEAMAALKDSWGEGYDRKVAQAKLIRDKHFKFFGEGPMNAATLEALANIATDTGVESDSLLDDEGQRVGGKLTRDEAKLRISEVMNNKAHPYWNAGDPGHGAAKNKMRELNIVAYN